MSRGPRSTARGVVIAGVLGSVGASTAGCIIPDSGIVVEDEFLNPGAVRIVEPTPVTPRADEACDERTILGACPRLFDTVPSGLISPGIDLCVCPGGRDLGLGEFDIFVEDPDVDDQDDPEDDILGVLLLDMPTDAIDPSPYVAYTSLLSPDDPARRFRASDLQTIERPDPHLKAWTLSGQPGVDLCNPTEGTAEDLVGLHDLRLVVTDRPWYRPMLFDADGGVMLDEDGEPVFGDPVPGVPDLAAGATYDTTTYVFQCHDGSDPPPGVECNCET